MMRWTRLSFFYLVGYLTLGGLALLFAPARALQLLGATGSYSAVLVRFMGSLLLALGVLVAQIVRHRVEALYPTTLVVRVVLVATMVSLYVSSRDPLFLVLTAIVGLGMALTATGFLADRRAGGQPHH